MENSKILVSMDTEKVQGLVARVAERKIGGVCRVIPIRQTGFEKIMDINRDCFPQWDEDTTVDLRFFYSSPDSIGFLLSRKKRPVAYIIGADTSACKGVFETDVETFYSCYAGVVPKYQRRGIYSALNTLRNVALFEKGYRRVFLHSVNNPDALGAHVANGYGKVELVEEHYDDGSDAWLMRKNLDAHEIAEEVSSLLETLK